MERNLAVIEKRINSLETHITDDERLFQDAVASFRNFISQSNFPQDVQNKFLNVKPFNGRAEYINSLRTVLSVCRKMYGKEQKEVDSTPSDDKHYTIDEDGVIHRNPKSQRNTSTTTFRQAMDLLREQTIKEEKHMAERNGTEFDPVLAANIEKFKQRRG